MKKLHEIVFYLPLQGHLFTDFQDQIKVEKLHGVKYTGAYENKSTCGDFPFCISEYFFEQNVKKKLTMVNFLAVLCDGSTDKSSMKQEVVYVTFADPETGNPTLTFLEVAAPSESQDAPGLKKAIIDTFKRNSLKSAIEKIVFLSSDGASVNCGKHSGFIELFQEDYPWVSFIWYFGNWLELTLKDAVKEVLEPVDTSLCNLYYVHAKSSKKHRELKNLFSVFEGQFEMYSAGVCPVKVTGMRWIDQKIRAMGPVVEKFGLYNEH